MKLPAFFIIVILSVYSINISAQNNSLAAAGERHLQNNKQLTFGGENAEAYFSFDGKKLIFQSKRDGRGCDQIYTMNAADGSDVKMVSTGFGRTTCSYYFKGGKRILYASTHLGAKECPPPADFSKGYVWAIYPSYDIFTANPGRLEFKTTNENSRLRRRSDDFARRQKNYFHVRARRRFGFIFDGRQRQKHQASDQ